MSKSKSENGVAASIVDRITLSQLIPHMPTPLVNIV